MFIVREHEGARAQKCPTGGTLLNGTSWMDGSMLTGEPYSVAKTLGSKLNGAQRIG